MRSCLLITVLALLLCTGTPSMAKDSVQFEVGSERFEIQEAALSTGGTRLYKDQIERELYGATFEPLGLHLIRELLEFEGDRAVRLVRTYTPWAGRVGLSEAETEAGQRKVMEALLDEVRRHEAVKQEGSSSHEVYLFETETTEGEIRIAREAPADGYVHEWANGLTKTFTPLVENEMWFGLGSVNRDEVKKGRATTSLPSQPETTFVWEVQIGESGLRDYDLVLRYPLGGPLPQIPEGVKFDRSRRELTMPIGLYEDKVVLELVIEEGDPPGIWRLALLSEGETVAAISYEVQEPGD